MAKSNRKTGVAKK